MTITLGAMQLATTLSTVLLNALRAASSPKWRSTNKCSPINRSGALATSARAGTIRASARPQQSGAARAEGPESSPTSAKT